MCVGSGWRHIPAMEPYVISMKPRNECSVFFWYQVPTAANEDLCIIRLRLFGQPSPELS